MKNRRLTFILLSIIVVSILGGWMHGELIIAHSHIMNLIFEQIDAHNWEMFRFGIEGFTIGGLFIMAVYHLALFTVRRKETIPLYFGLFCLFFGFYTFFTSLYGIFLQDLFGVNFSVKIRWFSAIIIVPLFLLYLKNLFPDLLRPNVVKISTIIFFIYCIILIIIPSPSITNIMSTYHLVYIMAICYCFLILLRAAKKKRIGAKLLLAMYFIFFVSVIHDIFYFYFQSFLDMRISPLGFLLFIGAHSYVLSMRFARAFNDVEKLSNEIITTQREVIFNLGQIAEGRSKEIGNHVKRVAEYSKLLAEKVGLPERQVELIKLASPMHDIGKIAIPDTILNKPGRLTKEEFEIMKTHTTLGYEMLKNSKGKILQLAAEIALTHHEKWDGTGYPQGLKGEDIPITGRITAIADVFDALGSPRVYKHAWNLDEILTYFKEQRGKHFDPKLVDLFFENLDQLLIIREQYSDEKINNDNQTA